MERIVKYHFFKDFFFFTFYFLLVFREESKGEGERGKKKKINVIAKHGLASPHQRPSLKPRYVTWLEIESATYQCAGQHPINWATLAGACKISLATDFFFIDLKDLFIYLTNIYWALTTWEGTESFTTFMEYIAGVGEDMKGVNIHQIITQKFWNMLWRKGTSW